MSPPGRIGPKKGRMRPPDLQSSGPPPQRLGDNPSGAIGRVGPGHGSRCWLGWTGPRCPHSVCHRTEPQETIGYLSIAMVLVEAKNCVSFLCCGSAKGGTVGEPSLGLRYASPRPHAKGNEESFRLLCGSDGSTMIPPPFLIADNSEFGQCMKAKTKISVHEVSAIKLPDAQTDERGTQSPEIRSPPSPSPPGKFGCSQLSAYTKGGQLPIRPTRRVQGWGLTSRACKTTE